MKNIKHYSVKPNLPEKLAPLADITKNLWWTWSQEAINLFRRVDRDLWELYEHNPVKMLGHVSQERLESILADDSFMMQFDRVREEFDIYQKVKTWYDTAKKEDCCKDMNIAYFSFEYGIHESLPNYSGGLGILSGDHMKSASDLGIPLVGVGLLYRKGYFRQYLNADGWQQEYDMENDFANLPVNLQYDKDGKPLKISVKLPGRDVYAQIWKADVGRVKIIYLDANLPENSPADREITSQLYGGDHENRIKQEMLLGMGGIEALELTGYKPTVYHMNEGHAAYLVLERLRKYIKNDGLSLHEAAQLVYASSVFTTHTPVPAGNDVFSCELMRQYFAEYCADINLPIETLLRWGRTNPDDASEGFCQTVLALNFSAGTNGVSKLHGVVSRDMWKMLWPDVPKEELPIAHITNGIHTVSWISFEMQGLYDRYLGPRWRSEPVNFEIWQRVLQIPDAELWRTHERRKERLVAFARKKLKKQLENRGYPQSEIMGADEVLDPDILTIGFARRFATYKRGTLIFRDMERLEKILNNSKCPVQIIFAGKAHPHDNGGKKLIREIAQIARKSEFRNRIVFLEDYDINVARYLVQGVDIWLNNPRRPLEASGTSGMKVPVNGGINLSVLDGWWDEAYDGTNGWAIGKGEEYADTEYQDEVESKALYTMLEKEVVPLYYNKARDGLPREWIKYMKASMATCCPEYNTNRMVEDYTTMFYMPAHKKHKELLQGSYSEAKALAEWKKYIDENWNSVSVNEITSSKDSNLQTGMEFTVSATLSLGKIKPEDVCVEIYHGPLNLSGEFVKGFAIRMKHVKDETGGKHLFEGKISCDETGENGYTVRVTPYHKAMSYQFEMKMVKWA